VVIILAILLLSPTFFRDSFRDRGWISEPLKLGLDLKGGVSILYQVESKEAVKSRLLSYAQSLRSEFKTTKTPLIKITLDEEGGAEILSITLLNEKSEDKARQLIISRIPELSLLRKEAGEGERVVLKYTLPSSAAESIKDEAISQAVETLRNRVDQFGVAEPLLQRQGRDRISVQIPGETDVEKVKQLIGRVAKLEFRLVPMPASNVTTIDLKDKFNTVVKLEDPPLMSGDSVSDANVSFRDGQIKIDLKMTSKGTTEFANLTSQNVGRQLAIVLDGIEYSRPTIQVPIRDGNAEITGGFSIEEARDLKFVLRSGALPAPLKVLEDRTVGPSLGQESIRKGVISIAVGFTMIMLFMLWYYRKSGLIAVASLALNVLLIFGILTLFGATLTLPGLVGVALTIGMAVDSNVIIFERIRDELRLGSGRDAAVNAGFDKAFTAILDSNLTTFLSGLILMYFGTGSIRGFAVTLCIGVATTVFCAVFASRLGFDALELHGSEKEALSI
jgi:preprotein translocase subunit SecD